MYCTIPQIIAIYRKGEHMYANEIGLEELYEMLSAHDTHVAHLYARLGATTFQARRFRSLDSLRNRIVDTILDIANS
jgi:hypothetical protein